MLLTYMVTLYHNVQWGYWGCDDRFVYVESEGL